MSNKLIIVESPTKVHTIQKFLGSGYEVIASQGHVRDLPKSNLGVDKENGFEPKYITIRGKGDIMGALKKAVKKADKIYLATDPDREGEAISWHLTKAFDMDSKEVYRITFNEITKDAVKNALKNPTAIDENLVSAQQARRVLDRVVGYELSPILWKKVKGKLSAGRVQSAVLKMVCDKEAEIQAFVPKEYWSFELELLAGKEKFTAEYYGTGDKKKELGNEKAVEALKKAISGKEIKVADVKTGTRAKAAPYPFTTSTLQQDAATFLNFPTKKTMMLAQQLYEGVKITGHGTIGLITYLRTDSTRIAAEADASCKAFVKAHYGDEFVGSGAVKNKDSAQDAHEAIRPTDVNLTPEVVKGDLQRDLFRLYQLIWKRFVASRMKSAVYDTANVKITAGNESFTSAMSRLSFKGFMTVYGDTDEKATGSSAILKCKPGETLALEDVKTEQHFTQPPLHFTEATLVRSMEELGLGRPSTYAPTITNILGKHYITKEGKNIFTTELGEVVNNLMENSFPDIVDLNFTAEMETSLDDIAEGKLDWHKMMRDFYPSFEKELRQAEAELNKVRVEDELSEELCDKCGRRMVYKFGAHGKFLACPGFPECRNTKPILEKIEIPCPKCGKELVARRTRKGRRYYGCVDAPNCDYMSWTKPKK